MKILMIILFIAFNSMFAFAQHAHDHTSEDSYIYPTDKKVLDKLANWQDKKFGLIIHWGTYSQWGVVESWNLCPEDADFINRTGPYGENWYEYKKAYENLPTTFNPTQFNPDSWAELAKNGGMKYVVFTTKHHDGFCMFDTKFTDYKVTNANCPFSTNPKRNIAKEVFNAFRKQDFMIGAYFSKPDWHSNDYWWSYFPPKDRNPSYDTKKYPERWARFKQFTYNQIEELMSGYGKIDILWLDGGQVRPPQQDIEMSKIAAMGRTHQPGLLVVDRTVSGVNENYITPEQQIPDSYISVPWETCLTIGDSWSYKPNDKYKSTTEIIHILCDIVAKGGNLLLNVGPQPNGELAPEQIQRINEIGAWMKVNGEAIYGTRPVAPYVSDKLAFTRKGDAVYAIYIPSKTDAKLPSLIHIQGFIPVKGSKISMLGSSTSINWNVVDNKLQLQLPKGLLQKLPCEHACTFKIQVEN